MYHDSTPLGMYATGYGHFKPEHHKDWHNYC